MQSLQSYLLTASAICKGDHRKALDQRLSEPCVKVRGGLLHVDGPVIAISFATDPQVEAQTSYRKGQ